MPSRFLSADPGVRQRALLVLVSKQRVLSISLFIAGAGLVTTMDQRDMRSLVPLLIMNPMYLFIALLVAADALRHIHWLNGRVAIPAMRRGGRGRRELTIVALLALACGAACGGLVFMATSLFMLARHVARDLHASGPFPVPALLMPAVILLCLTCAAFICAWYCRRASARFKLEVADSLALCAHCRYPRDGLASSRCPECGALRRQEHPN